MKHLTAHKPHARRLQLYETRVRRVPSEVHSGRRDMAMTTLVVPESTAVANGAVVVIVSVRPRVIVAVIRGELPSILVNECIVDDVACINNSICLMAVLCVYFMSI